MNQKTRSKVSLSSPIFLEIPRLSDEEIARLEAEDRAFAKRCRAIFEQMYPELITNYYNWFIIIEPDSGDYFIDPNEMVAFQKAKHKHPDSLLLAMRLNETGACGRI